MKPGDVVVRVDATSSLSILEEAEVYESCGAVKVTLTELLSRMYPALMRHWQKEWEKA